MSGGLLDPGRWSCDPLLGGYTCDFEPFSEFFDDPRTTCGLEGRIGETTGCFRVGVAVDPRDLIAEDDELNNVVERQSPVFCFEDAAVL